MQGGGSQRRILVLKGQGGEGLHSGKQEVFIGMVVHSGGNIIKGANDIIRVPGGPGGGGAIAVPKTGFQDKVQTPASFFH